MEAAQLSLNIVKNFIPEDKRENATVNYRDEPGYSIINKDNQLTIEIGRLAGKNLITLQQNISEASENGGGFSVTPTAEELRLPMLFVQSLKLLQALDPRVEGGNFPEYESEKGVYRQVATVSADQENIFVDISPYLMARDINKLAKALAETELKENGPKTTIVDRSCEFVVVHPSALQTRYLVLAALVIFTVGVGAGYGLNAFFHPAPIGPVYR